MPPAAPERPVSTPVAAEYRALAPAYDRRWAAYVEHTTRATLARLQVRPGDRLLDVGCGTGALLAKCHETSIAAGMAGVDLVPEMLSVARQRLPETVLLCTATADALPLVDAHFDVLVSVSAFHFMPRPEATLTEMRRVLRPGGRIAITDWCADFVSQRLFEVYLRARGAPHFRTHTTRSLERMLRAAGFSGIRIDRYRVPPFWGMMTASAVRQPSRTAS